MAKKNKNKATNTASLKDQVKALFDIDFMGKRQIAMTISAILVIASFILLFVRGLNLGIDFTGGTLLQVKFDKPVKIADLRVVFEKLGLKVNLQPVAKGDFSNLKSGLKLVSDEYVITTQLLGDKEGEAKYTKDFVMKKIEDELHVKIVQVLRATDVGPVIGAELRAKAAKAILLSLIAMLIYIAYRFEMIFGIAATIALIHDVSITLGLFSWIHLEVDTSFVAAILTIIGYSLNDSIVISDRIRENMRMKLTKDLPTLINISLNQTLSRTLNTSITTLIPLTILLAMGGRNLLTFSLALWAGVIVGTYSSIFIVSPLIVWWKEKNRV